MPPLDEDKTLDQKRDVNNNPISVGNDFDIVGSPLTVDDTTPVALDVSGECVELILMPVGGDLMVGKDTPITDHDLVTDESKEVFGVAKLDTIYVQAVTGSILVYFRKVLL